MNRPFIKIVAEDGNSYPASSPLSGRGAAVATPVAPTLSGAKSPCSSTEGASAPFSLTRWLALGAHCEAARDRLDQAYAALDAINALLSLNLEAEAHNPLESCACELRTVIEEMGFEDRASNNAAAYADYINDCRRNDDA